MTREEAISWLVSLTEHEGEDIPIYDSDVEAINIAIDTMRKYQKIEQIQAAILERVRLDARIEAYDSFKKDYENRLKADLVAMLTELQLEIEELNTPPVYQDEDYFLIGTNKCSELIQQKIDKYKAESEGE